MPRARKRKAEPCESNQIESETAPVPHEPSDKEASCDEVPVTVVQRISRARMSIAIGWC